jgi:hypothetical protein
MYFLMAMNSHACLSGASLADMHLTGYVSHRVCMSLDVHLSGRASLRTCISQDVHLIGMYLMEVHPQRHVSL